MCGRFLAEMTACCFAGLASASVLNYCISPQLVIPPVVCSCDSLAGLAVHISSVTGCFWNIPVLKEIHLGMKRGIRSQFMDMFKTFDSFHNRTEGTFLSGLGSSLVLDKARTTFALFCFWSYAEIWYVKMGWHAISWHTLKPKIHRRALGEGCPGWSPGDGSSHGFGNLAEDAWLCNPHPELRSSYNCICLHLQMEPSSRSLRANPSVIMPGKVEKSLLLGSASLRVYLDWHSSNWKNYIWSSLSRFWRQTVKTRPCLIRVFSFKSVVIKCGQLPSYSESTDYKTNYMRAKNTQFLLAALEISHNEAKLTF